MDGKLTKTDIKNELQRRIDWLEKSYGFNDDLTLEGIKSRNIHVQIYYGRWKALRTIKSQIENGLFIGGHL